MSPSPVLGVVFGALLGSFANVCIHRIPRGKSIVRPGSRCPRCRASIPWYLNIPVLSYVLLRGRCASCRRSISLRYPLVELLTAAVFAWAFFRDPEWTGALLGALLGFSLVVIGFIDADWRIIPDAFSLGLVWLGLALAPLNERLGSHGPERALASIAGAAFGFLSAWGTAWLGKKIFGKEALGGGDVKLLAGLGALLGWPGVVTTWFLGALLGTLVFAALKLRRRLDWGGYLPFGPFLAAGAWAHWIWPSALSGLWGW